jgi:hypothetical protein
MCDRTLMSGHPRASRRDFVVDFFSPAFIGGGRPQVPLRALFQARGDTRVEPPTFRKPAGWLPHMFRPKWGSNLQRWGTSDLKSTTLTTRPRRPLVWIHAGRKPILLVLSWRSSIVCSHVGHDCSSEKKGFTFVQYVYCLNVIYLN